MSVSEVNNNKFPTDLNKNIIDPVIQAVAPAIAIVLANGCNIN